MSRKTLFAVLIFAVALATRLYYAFEVSPISCDPSDAEMERAALCLAETGTMGMARWNPGRTGAGRQP